MKGQEKKTKNKFIALNHIEDAVFTLTKIVMNCSCQKSLLFPSDQSEK